MLELQAARVKLPLEQHSLVDAQIGLIRLFDFPSAGDCDFIATFQTAIDGAIDDLKRQGARAWVLDLRGNPGGSALSASLLAGTLGFDGLLMDVRERGGLRTPYETTGTNLLGGAPLSILVDGDSASASEVVAYALQDSRRAHVVGQRTAGEVAASVPIPIAGGALMVTVGLVDVGPAHHPLQGSGVTPNQQVSLDLALLARTGRDSQLDAAVEYLRSKLR
jgi:carboxyl-terminal processing protease